MHRHPASIMAAFALFVAADFASAQALVYVDAKDGYYPDNNLYTTAGTSFGTLIEPGNNTFVNGDGRFPADGAWHWANFGSPWGDETDVLSVCGLECTSVYESLQEDAPLIGMRLGLESSAALNPMPGVSYDVYAVYWGDVGGNWGVQAGLDASNLTLFNTDGGDGTVQGQLGGSAAWTVRPMDNRTDGNDPEDAFYPPSDDNDNPFLDVTPGSPAGSARSMYLGLVGTATASGSGQIDVFIDDQDAPDDEGGLRAFFDGLAFVPSGTPVFTSGAVNRETGVLTISNPTAVDFLIESVSIRSPSGSLNATQWNNVSDDNVINDPDGDWAVTSPNDVSVVELAEEDAGNMNGVTWMGAGTTLDLGAVWRQGIFEDVVVDLNLVGGGTVQITPTFDGDAYQTGDFDADRDIDTDDYLLLVQGLHADHATTSLAYSLGDINGSGAVNRDDVLAFGATFNAFNGEGSFEAMIAGLSAPEPSTGLLSALAFGSLWFTRRRPLSEQNGSRRNRKGCKSLATVIVACFSALALLSNSAQAVPVVDWQIDPLVPNSGMNLSNEATSSPTVGLMDVNGTAIPDSADQTAIWGSIPIDVDLVNGQEVALTGSIRIHNDGGGGSSFNNGGFRWGIFQDDTPTEGELTGSWLGYLASSSAGNASGVGDGRLTVKNPDSGEWETATPLSTINPATELGGDGRVYDLAGGGSIDPYNDGTYEFGVVIGRYGDEVTVSSFLRLANPEGDYNDDGAVDIADFTVWRDNLGTSFTLPNRDKAITGDVSIEDYEVWRNNFGVEYNHVLGGGTDTNEIPHPLFPVATDPETNDPLPVTPHVSFSYNRVAFLLADHLNADFAEFDQVDISPRPIESITLEINTSTGEGRLLNVSNTDFEMTYYEITSPSGSLVEANWNSLAPDATIDGVDWDRAAGSDEFVLSEINLLGAPEQIPVSITPISLGSIWDTGGQEDITLFFIDEQGTLIRGIVQYVGAGPIATPEPAAAVLLLAVFTALGLQRRGARLG